jgi:lipoate-protein ligase A
MSTSKRTMAVAIAALAVAGGGGAAIAASQGSSASPEAFFDSLAEHLGISSEELEDAAKAAANDQVDAALEEGRITDEQAERLRERIEEGETPFLFGSPLFGRPDFGPPIFGGVHHGRAIFGTNLEAAAEYLGLTRAELRERLEEGQSLAEIARAEDKSVDGLKQALLRDAEQRLDDAVEDGELTRERANEMLERMRGRIDELVERGFEAFGPPILGLHHHGGPVFLMSFEAAAKYLDLTRAQLRERLEEGQSLADVARAEDKSVAGLKRALLDDAEAQLDEAVQEGELTRGQANEKLESVREKVDDFVERDFEAFGPPVLGLHHHGGPALVVNFEVAADYLGLTDAELRERLEEGQSLAEIARAEDKSVDGLERALLRDAEQRLNDAVEDGELTRARANEMLERLRDKVEDFVERGFEAPAAKPFGFDRRMPEQFGPRLDREFLPPRNA